MTEHTRASTAGSAHARYVAYREDGYSPEGARQLADIVRVAMTGSRHGATQYKD